MQKMVRNFAREYAALLDDFGDADSAAFLCGGCGLRELDAAIYLTLG